MVKTKITITHATVIEGEIEAKYKAKAEKIKKAMMFFSKPFFLLLADSVTCSASGKFGFSTV